MSEWVGMMKLGLGIFFLGKRGKRGLKGVFVEKDLTCLAGWFKLSQYKTGAEYRGLIFSFESLVLSFEF